MVTQERLREAFKYEEGELIWIIQPVGRFKVKGEIAGYISQSGKSKGYRRVAVDGKEYFAHRLIFLFHCGYLPTQIDHVNRDKSDNRLSNLRECTQSQNNINQKTRSDNTSGHKGVDWRKCRNRWRVRIGAGKEVIFVGQFKTLEEAIKARKEAELELYGEFANGD